MIINIAGGTGVMGSVHKPIFESAGHKVILSGRKTSPNLEEAAKQSDLTIVSVPISATEEIIKIVAPHCKALMDFTGIKSKPIEWMLKYSKEDCEVAGLHPLYGNVQSIKDKTLVYCPTSRTGNRCNEVIQILEKAGARILEMDSESHDRAMVYVQNARRLALQSFGLLLKESGMTLEQAYAISPPPTKIILDLLARQEDEKNDEMYKEMRKYNPLGSPIELKLLGKLDKAINSPDVPKQIREFFADSLKDAQQRAKDIIKKSDNKIK